MSVEKSELISKFRVNEKDTGSAEVQIALLSQRINDLGGHFKSHIKDHQSRRGLLQLVGRRKRLLTYLKSKDEDQYKKITKELGLRG